MVAYHVDERNRQMRETAALLLVGDGLLGLLNPSAHCAVWRTGNDCRWDTAVAWFAAHPALVRMCAATELAAGLWLAERGFASLVTSAELVSPMDPVAAISPVPTSA